VEEGELEALAVWLGGRLDSKGPVAITGVEALSTGFSAETLSLQTRWENGTGAHTGRFVLRRESPEPAVYPQQAPDHDVEVEIQYEVMRALRAGTDAPLAGLIGYEGSSELLGAPFFVMEFVDGLVPLVTPTYAAEGFFAEAAPVDRRRMIEDGLRRLAQVHSLDWRGGGLGWLLPDGEAPTALRQVDIWERYTERELAGRRLPLVTDAFEWLRRQAPTHRSEDVTFNWGDPRPGNMIWRDFQCVCITDFEAASIAPYGVDLGWWLMFDRWSHEQSGASRLEGEPTREEQAAAYFDAAGRPPAPTHWFEVFAAVRYCAIVVRIMNRTVDRGLMPADNDYWRDNQATACLQELLG
jgi:aminoglycoside phosphotransferase (APT) family kinase protein